MAGDDSIKLPEIDLSVKAEINLYYDLFVPDGTRANAPLLLAVHGYGAHKRYMIREARRRTRRLGDWVCPGTAPAFHQARRRLPHRFRLADRPQTRRVRRPAPQVLLDVIEKLSNDGTIDREQVYLYGFSQACTLNFRFAFTNPDAMRGIVGVCGGIPGDLDTNPVYKPFDAETFYLYGDDDDFYAQEKFTAFDEKLSSRLPNYRSKQYVAKHEITDEMREDVRAFLEKH